MPDGCPQLHPLHLPILSTPSPIPLIFLADFHWDNRHSYTPPFAQWGRWSFWLGHVQGDSIRLQAVWAMVVQAAWAMVVHAAGGLGEGGRRRRPMSEGSGGTADSTGCQMPSPCPCHSQMVTLNP